MNLLEIRIKQSYYIRLIFIGLFSLGIGAILMLLEQRRWAKIFDNVGVTRRDGKQFRWLDLKDIKYIYIKEGVLAGKLNNIELIFNDGKALVFPLVLENGNEIMEFLKNLPSTSNKSTI